MIVSVNVDDQSLRWYDRPPKIADKSIQFVKFKFNLSPEWEGYQVTAQFTQKDTYNMLLKNDYCDLPVEITAGPCLVSVFGYSPDQSARATVIPLLFTIEQSGFVGDGQTPIPPTPDLYAQLLISMNESLLNGVPVIRDNHWWVWDTTKKEYVNTNLPSLANLSEIESEISDQAALLDQLLTEIELAATDRWTLQAKLLLIQVLKGMNLSEDLSEKVDDLKEEIGANANPAIGGGIIIS